ncbi:HAMP domain-containing sensor histidine kinase [Simplicispira suum]|uniref:histidine kinase n=1 Tax=Simplicispira suum TaxID=2109915 RepID=A0A2S0MZ75_9BURK|nr:HAMP domain-containing sensor histidine kinase [Simplicispira suum]AVO40993.1 two-component sensor histidine kinase [Simplicispira suum]
MRRTSKGRHAAQAPWHRRARQAVHRSLRLRLVLVFVLLALAMAVTFIGGVQKAVSVGWREAARPLLVDYVDHLAREVGSPPSIARAQAITTRLPITLRISGPTVNWDSQPDAPRPGWARDSGWHHGAGGEGVENLLLRTTADGHRLEFGLNMQTWQQRPRIAWITLGVLLLLTALAYLYVRRLLRPLDDIRAGAERFGAGAFDEPIPVRCAHKPDELGQLAATINTMGGDIRQMLDAKRALLLAMSHELRSPLTRARLNAELLPETPAVDPQRQALLRDLGEMARLITDLLESERLAGSHAALHRESVDLVALAREVVAELGNRHAGAAAIAIHAPPGLAPVALDRARMRLLLRNLLDNALRHNHPFGQTSGNAAAAPPELRLQLHGDELGIEVRDYGPGVPPEHLAQLAQAFYRPDSARQRATGGVGLGLYLCRLVAQAHGGRLELRNAEPGLEVRVVLPVQAR